MNIIKKSALAATLFLAGAAMLGGTTSAFAAQEASSLMKNSSIENFGRDTRVFKTDASIQVKKVHFQNRYGISVTGDLYLPPNFDEQKKYAAVALSGPFGAVKEQVSGLYAQELARRGFVAVAFDPSFTGESGGNVRDVASPDIFTEDFSAAIDFIGMLPYVDRERLGAMGICGLSGPAITAATNDLRIKAVAVSAMYDMVDSIRNHYKGDYYTPKQREIVKQYLAEMRWKEAEKGSSIPGYHEIPVDKDGKVIRMGKKLLPDKLPEGADSVTKEFFDYYCGRAYHERSINSAAAWSSTTPYGFFNFPLDSHIEEISPRPIMLITGDKAHSKYHSDDVYKRAKKPKELLVVPGATHTDLYDQLDKIPFDKLAAYFNQYLK
ncbi:MAG: alpha/beta hydrolase [Desulfovibrionaceae bacterium]|nr:alpha/beta hydrolase [Desulfovibrionaceae bacterium]